MKLRTADVADIDAILRLIRETPTLPQWHRDALAIPGLSNPETGLQRAVIVADSDATLAGFAQYSLLLGEAELESMAVSRSMRRQGVGRALLTGLLAEVSGRGATCLRLEVRSGNVGAIALYRRAAMHLVGHRRNYYSDPVEDACVMQRSWEM